VVALSLFHHQHIVHHDLKPQNIFIDENVNVIIGDFGEARYFTFDHTSTTTGLGTMLYMAPEMLKGEKFVFKMLNYFIFFSHSYPCDIWSLGVILYEVFSFFFF
jgi:serine/threonine protein kinase